MVMRLPADDAVRGLNVLYSPVAYFDGAIGGLPGRAPRRQPTMIVFAVFVLRYRADGALMERYPTAILDTSMLPLPKADMKHVFMDAWLAQPNERLRSLLEI